MFHPKGPSFFELAVQALCSTEHGYDLLAPKFDYTPFRTPDWLLQLVAAELRQTGPYGTALDLCCGTGTAMRWLRPLCRDRLVGVDFSRGMLAVARQNLAAGPGDASSSFVRANTLSLPFDSAFDLVVCFGALGHILERDEPRFVAEIARVLKPGGRFATVTSYMPPILSVRCLMARAFNGAMRVRNLLISPPFIMYYLTFRLPDARKLMEQNGLEVEERSCGNAVPDLRLVIATRPARPRSATQTSRGARVQ
jgi:ubiquinone/menaquinone biosynthesis C-methylase UbiE